jgi:hypothetical protein
MSDDEFLKALSLVAMMSYQSKGYDLPGRLVLHTVLKLLLDPDINDGGSVSYVTLFQSKAADVCFNRTCVLQLDKGAQPR